MAKTMLGSVLIGGGTGFIGTHLSRLLKNKGYSVTLVSRMPGPDRMSWNDLNRLGLPTNTTAVVNLAGQNVLDPTHRWSPGFKQNVYNSRINTTSALAQSIIAAEKKPFAFVTISGVGIYKPHKEKSYDEHSKIEEFDFFSHLCHEWEKSAELPTNIKTRRVTIRSGVVIGGEGGMIKQLYLPFYFGLGGPVGSGDQYLPWIHITDLTRLIIFAIETNKVRGILNGVSPQCITNKQFTEAFAKAMKRPAVIPLPKFVLNLVLNEERAKILTQGQKVKPKRVEALGFNFLFPDIEQACMEVIDSPKMED